MLAITFTSFPVEPSSVADKPSDNKPFAGNRPSAVDTSCTVEESYFQASYQQQEQSDQLGQGQLGQEQVEQEQVEQEQTYCSDHPLLKTWEQSEQEQAH